MSTLLMERPLQLGHELQLENVSQTFKGQNGQGTVTALLPTNIHVKPGEFVGLVGPSGCGKTTALNMIGGIVKPTHGRVLVGGKPAREGHPEVGYLMARDSLLPWRTAQANVVLPLELKGVPKPEAQERAADILKAVGLGSFLDAYPSQLSHGMRQRVAVARTLVSNPGTILMDEPFSALDAETRLKLQAEFLRLWDAHKSTVVFVTHDLAEAIIMCDRILVFSARPGKIVANFEIDLPRPRQVLELQGNAQYQELFREIWSIFRRELK
ncbi:MAG: ABC transporter ATP-binding protein [Burkholderiaceae bacterium]|nr:ABC transporter ATP-binding protein [Burkholderiaceae bacterium]